MKSKRKRVIKITIKEFKKIIELGFKIYEVVDEGIKLIKKFK